VSISKRARSPATCTSRGFKATHRWRSAFLRRYPEVKYKTPRSIVAARRQPATRETLGAFYDLFEEHVIKAGVPKERVFNTDETFITEEDAATVSELALGVAFALCLTTHAAHHNLHRTPVLHAGAGHVWHHLPPR
jgi:hypothetical protein